jgi:general secretion pathway protein B
MSSILKALKKLEHEKAVKKPDSFKIDAEILRGGSQRRVSSAGASLAALALFFSGVGATYLYMKYENKSVQVHTPHLTSDEPRGVAVPAAIPVPVSPPVPITTQQPPRSVPILSFPDTSAMSPRVVEKQQKQGKKTLELVPQTPPVEPQQVVPSLPQQAAQNVTPVKPVIKVHGIAFQDGAESVAVANGITISKGSIVEGAIVDEILKDRVKFSRGGEKFEVILDKSN